MVKVYLYILLSIFEDSFSSVKNCTPLIRWWSWIRRLVTLPGFCLIIVFHLYEIACFSLSIRRQKGESQNGCFKKTKHAKFSEKLTFFYPLIHTHMYADHGVKNVRFSENLVCFVFLKHPF